jgi:UDP-N-acetylmuramate-alanine ligase
MSKHVHLIGIGGSGLSAIARVLKQSGWVVSGSDQLASFLKLITNPPFPFRLTIK